MVIVCRRLAATSLFHWPRDNLSWNKPTSPEDSDIIAIRSGCLLRRSTLIPFEYIRLEYRRLRYGKCTEPSVHNYFDLVLDFTYDLLRVWNAAKVQIIVLISVDCLFDSEFHLRRFLFSQSSFISDAGQIGIAAIARWKPAKASLPGCRIYPEIGGDHATLPSVGVQGG